MKARRAELGNQCFPDTRTGVKSYKLNLEDIPSYYRPFVYYVAIYLMDVLASLVLTLLKFKKKVQGKDKYQDGLVYWVREKGQKFHSNDEVPIVFIHGIGIGLATYLRFFYDLAKHLHSHKMKIILIELNHVSMKLNVDVAPM